MNLWQPFLKSSWCKLKIMYQRKNKLPYKIIFKYWRVKKRKNFLQK